MIWTFSPITPLPHLSATKTKHVSTNGAFWKCRHHFVFFRHRWRKVWRWRRYFLIALTGSNLKLWRRPKFPKDICYENQLKTLPPRIFKSYVYSIQVFHIWNRLESKYMHDELDPDRASKIHDEFNITSQIQTCYLIIGN